MRSIASGGESKGIKDKQFVCSECNGYFSNKGSILHHVCGSKKGKVSTLVVVGLWGWCMAFPKDQYSCFIDRFFLVTSIWRLFDLRMTKSVRKICFYYVKNYVDLIKTCSNLLKFYSFVYNKFNKFQCRISNFNES